MPGKCMICKDPVEVGVSHVSCVSKQMQEAHELRAQLAEAQRERDAEVENVTTLARSIGALAKKVLGREDYNECPSELCRAMDEVFDAANAQVEALREALAAPVCPRCDDSGTVTIHNRRSQEFSTTVCPSCRGVGYRMRQRITAALSSHPAPAMSERESDDLQCANSMLEDALDLGRHYKDRADRLDNMITDALLDAVEPGVPL